MRILMLGNSYIYTNDMPSMIAELTGAEVVSHTRGGAWLSEQLNPETEMGADTQKALAQEHWDYVVLQEYSNGPISARETFLESAAALCEKIRSIQAVPVFYLTWAYQKNGQKMQETGFDYEEMHRGLQEAYRMAAMENQALLADVGTVFYEKSSSENLFMDDGSHPNAAGSRVAAEVIASVILDNWRQKEGN